MSLRPGGLEGQGGPGHGRDSEDAPTVHPSGGTAERAVTPYRPCSVGALWHRRRNPDRGAPSAEEAFPCNSRLRPPPPTTTAPRAGRHRPSDRVSSCPGPGCRGRGIRLSLRDQRHVSTVAGRGSPAARHPPLPPPAPTRARRRRRAPADRRPDGRARVVALARDRGTAQLHRPSPRDGLRHPWGTLPRHRPGAPRSPDCAGPPTCHPPTPR